MWMRSYATSQRRGTASCHGRFTVPKVFPLGPLASFLIWEKLVAAGVASWHGRFTVPIGFHVGPSSWPLPRSTAR